MHRLRIVSRPREVIGSYRKDGEGEGRKEASDDIARAVKKNLAVPLTYKRHEQ